MATLCFANQRSKDLCATAKPVLRRNLIHAARNQHAYGKRRKRCRGSQCSDVSVVRRTEEKQKEEKKEESQRSKESSIVRLVHRLPF